MKQTIFFALLALLIITPLRINAGWVEQDTGTIQGYRGITLSNDNLIAVGNSGNTVYSTDQGASWVTSSNFANNWWFDITTNADGDAVAIGEYGAYVVSSDGGVTWTQSSLDSSVHFYSIDMSDEKGYLVGQDGTLYYWSNTSNRWFGTSTGIAEDLYAVQDMGDGTAWAGGEQGRLIVISNSGISISDKGRITNDHIRGLYFESSAQGWVIGDNGTFRKTNDSGVSWVDVSIDGLTGQDLYDMQASSDRIVVTGEEIVIVSEDGGETWVAEPFADNYIFYSAYVEDDAYWIAGTNYDVWSLVLKFENDVEEVVEEVDEEVEEEEVVEEEEETEEELVVEAEEGNLIKMLCEAEDASATDPCRAVYYYADDGYRHAFPNEKIFFTWFDDFDDVIEVSADFLSDIPLGSNVTYHPGTKMVKFITVPTVYTVSLGGVLRAIGSEEVASELYGSDWNQQIDDIADVFLGNYTFGEDIESADDYDVDTAISSASSLDANF